VVLIAMIVLVHGASISSLGLALATWVPRQGRAVGFCVAAYLIVSVGWIILIAALSPRREPNGNVESLACLSPIFGSIYLWEHMVFQHGEVAWVFAVTILWLGTVAGAAMLLYALTLATFDRRLGRTSDWNDELRFGPEPRPLRQSLASGHLASWTSLVKSRQIKAVRFANIDTMSGVEFEHYLEKLLSLQGYSVKMTPSSGDLGVDLVASRNGEKIAIQAKCHKNKVSRHAVSDAVAAMSHYACNKAMVITNNYFQPGAKMLAASSGCILIDRDALADWIGELESEDKQPLPRDSSFIMGMLAALVLGVCATSLMITPNDAKPKADTLNENPAVATPALNKEAIEKSRLIARLVDEAPKERPVAIAPVVGDRSEGTTADMRGAATSVSERPKEEPVDLTAESKTARETARKADSIPPKSEDEEALPELKVGDRIMIHDSATGGLVWLARSEADHEAMVKAEALVKKAIAEKKSGADAPRTELAAEGRIVPVKNDVLALVRTVAETTVEVIVTVGESKGVKGWVSKALVKDWKRVLPQYRVTDRSGRTFDIFSYTTDPTKYEFVTMDGEVSQRFISSIVKIEKLDR
jgi:hypothetical protein